VTLRVRVRSRRTAQPMRALQGCAASARCSPADGSVPPAWQRALPGSSGPAGPLLEAASDGTRIRRTCSPADADQLRGCGSLVSCLKRSTRARARGRLSVADKREPGPLLPGRHPQERPHRPSAQGAPPRLVGSSRRRHGAQQPRRLDKFTIGQRRDSASPAANLSTLVDKTRTAAKSRRSAALPLMVAALECTVSSIGRRNVDPSSSLPLGPVACKLAGPLPAGRYPRIAVCSTSPSCSRSRTVACLMSGTVSSRTHRHPRRSQAA